MSFIQKPEMTNINIILVEKTKIYTEMQAKKGKVRGKRRGEGGRPSFSLLRSANPKLIGKEEHCFEVKGNMAKMCHFGDT